MSINGGRSHWMVLTSFSCKLRKLELPFLLVKTGKCQLEASDILSNAISFLKVNFF